MVSLLKLLLFFLFVFFVSIASAQNITVSIKDSVTMEQLSFATVELNIEGSGKSNNYSTDVKGILVLEKPKNIFQLKVSYVGYKTNLFTVDPTKVDHLIILKISKTSNFLKGLTITAKAQVITQTPNGYVYSVDRNTAEINVNTAQLLKKLPGIVPEQNGELRLQGRPIVFYIDGKPSLLSGTELNKYLQTLNLQDVKNLKILTNPPANYDASGGSVIDITTNKQIIPGISARVDANGGTHDKYGAALNLNYNSSKYTGKYSVNYDHSNLYRRSGYTQLNKNGPDSLRNYEFSSQANNSPSNSTNVVLNNDFALDKNNTIGLTVKFSNFNNEPSITSSQLDISNSSDKLLQQQNLYRIDQSNSNLFYVDLNYRLSLNKKGTSLTFDSYYWKRDAKNYYTILEDNFSNGMPISQVGEDVSNYSLQKLDIKSTSLALLHPVNKYITFSSGVKLTTFKIDGTFNNQILLNNLFVTDPNQTYQLHYQEDVYAGYISVSGKYKELQYSLGIRGEGTILKLNTMRDDGLTENNNHFFDPFPVAGIVYSVSGQSSISASYGRRIYRVSYSQLNPIDFRIDPSTIQRGNPSLTPSTTDNFNLNYNYQLNNKHNFSISASYLKETNPYTWITLPDSNSTTFISEPKNYKEFNYLTVNLNQQHVLSKKISLTANLLASEQKYDLSNLSLPNPKSVISYRASISLSIKPAKNTNFEIFGNFKSHSTTPFGTGAQYQYIDVSASKRLLNDNLTVSLNINDIFNLNKSNYLNNSPFYNNLGFIKNETSIAQLALSYRFGKTKKNTIKDYTPQEDSRFKN